MFSLRNTSLQTKEKAVPRARSRPGASQPLVRKRGGGITPRQTPAGVAFAEVGGFFQRY